MTAISLIGSQCSGHGSFPPRPTTSGSSNVIINGKGAARVGDSLAVHCDPDSCHPGSIAQGSSTVLINGKGAARVGDKVNCGSTLAMGSPNVFAG